MSKEIKNKIEPKLRFPEFRDRGEWREKRLGEILNEFKLGGNYENSEMPTRVPVIKMGNLERGNININKLQYLPENEIYEDTDILKKGDLLFNTRNTLELVGKVAIWKEELPFAVYNSNLLRLTFLKEYIQSNYFINYCLNTDTLLKRIRNLATGTTSVAAIYTKDLLKLKISFPSLQEQQKIASCLSSLDELITAESEKLEALKTHKKGLMQQLFPAEGETVPKLRFAEFKDSGEWEEKKLKQVAYYENGKAHEQDIVETGAYIVVNSKFISSDGEVRKFSNTPYCLAVKNDILMVLSDVPNGKAISKCFFVDADDAYSVNQRICKISAFDANSLMLFYIMNRNEYFLAFDDGVKQTNLKNDDVLNFPFLLPVDLEEQQKIASCLSSLDEVITAQAEKIEALKVHKKGLMQGLFPSEL